MSTSLSQLLFNPDLAINVTVELTSAKRSDGTAKTWYFARFVDSLLLTAHNDFMPYLTSVGPLTQSLSLSETSILGDMADVSAGSIILTQLIDPNTTGSDKLSQLLDYSFAGYTATIKIGELSVDAYSAYYTFKTAIVEVEPILTLSDTGVQITLALASILSRLASEPITISRYVGIPTCIRHLTTTGIATATRIAAYDLSTFTIMLRFRTVSAIAPTGNVILCRKRVSDTDANWNIRMLASSGAVNFNASGAGVANDINLNDSTNFADSLWHTVICSRYLTTFAYLVIDGVQRGSDSTLSAANLSVANVQFGVLNNSADDIEICDVRIYKRFFYQDDAIALSQTVADASDPFLVGYWRCDDNTGGTINDYTSNNNDATLAGVLNTDYSWQPSYLGGPEWAGKLYPYTLGVPFNCPTHLIDTSRQIHRTHISNLETDNRTVNLKSRGVALVQTTDYTDNADGTFKMVSAQSEPVTFDVTQSPRDYDNTAPRIVYTLLEAIASTGQDGYEQMIAVSNLLSGAVGFNSSEALTYGQIISRLLGDIGAHVRESASYPIVDFILPPIGLSPYSEPVIDFGGHPESISFGNLANVTSNHTICAWFKTFAIDQSADSSTPGIYQVLISKPDAYLMYYYMGGTNNGQIIVSLGSGTPTTVNSSPGTITDGTWYFVAHVYDDTANTMTLYLAPYGSSLVQISQTTGATPTIGTGFDLTTGFGTWGSVSGIHIWNVTKTLVQLQTLMTTPPVGNESNLVFFAPMSEGTGDVSDKVTGTIANTPFQRVGYYNKWAPALTVNLNITPSVKLTDFRHIAPAYKININYGINWNKMPDADINTSVSQSNRINLKSDHTGIAPFNSSSLRSTYKRSREITLNTCLTEQASAFRLLRMLTTRLSSDRYIATLDFPAGEAISRRALGLSISDEIMLISPIPTQLASGRSMRVIGVTQDPITLSVRLICWG